MSQYPQELLDGMKALADDHGLNRVEIQVDVPELAPNGRNMLRNAWSILYLPGLGWTHKDDLTTHDWGSATILAHDL